MIEMHTSDGINFPILVCDVCGERITDASKAAAVFENFAPNGSRVKVQIVHKGNIDDKTCHQVADAKIVSEGGRPGWQELKRHIVYLAANIGFPPNAMQAYDDPPPF